MFDRLLILAMAALLCCLAHAASTQKQSNPSLSPTTSASVSVTIDATPAPAPTTTYALQDVQLVPPQYISIARFEELLKRAGEMFAPIQIVQSAPNSSPPRHGQTTQADAPIAPIPYQQMQPPSVQPYNFYLPMYEYEDAKLDAKSRKMERFAPPPEQLETIYYVASKPKKLPKKFDAAAKQVNMKWYNAHEKVAQRMPPAVYLEHDERNRINFDDTFFAVDTPVQIPDNEPHKEDTADDKSGEDMLAAAASQLPRFSQAFSRHRQ